MSGFDRQIAYLSLYENGIKRNNAGYVKWESDQKTHKIEVHIKGLYETDTAKANVTAGDGRLIGIMDIVEGKGDFRRKENGIEIGMDKIPLTEFHDIVIKLNGNRSLEASWVNLCKIDSGRKAIREDKALLDVVEESASNDSKVTDIDSKTLQAAQETATNIKQEKTLPYYESKWSQLAEMFSVVRPFQDDREFLKITPKDFYILRESYQHLSHNSFLLHGYYNYQYLILGKKQEDNEDAYFLGVPGVYYEREIMAAKMFGFEGFECASKECEPGSFGYYMVSVE